MTSTPPEARMEHQAEFRFYEELNDFLPPECRKRSFEYRFQGTPCVGEAIEALGIPLGMVELILIHGVSVEFGYRLQPNDRVAVYPVFESFDLSSLVRVREKPLREMRFLVDAELGQLACLLQWSGFDARNCQGCSESAIGPIAAREKRTVLTRNQRLLGDSSITHGYCIRATHPSEQLAEVIQRFDLADQLAPFTR